MIRSTERKNNQKVKIGTKKYWNNSIFTKVMLRDTSLNHGQKSKVEHEPVDNAEKIRRECVTIENLFKRQSLPPSYTPTYDFTFDSYKTLA